MVTEIKRYNIPPYGKEDSEAIWTDRAARQAFWEELRSTRLGRTKLAFGLYERPEIHNPYPYQIHEAWGFLSGLELAGILVIQNFCDLHGGKGPKSKHVRLVYQTNATELADKIEQHIIQKFDGEPHTQDCGTKCALVNRPDIDATECNRRFSSLFHSSIKASST